MSKPDIKLLEAAAIKARTAAFDEMFAHMLLMTRCFGRSIMEQESIAGQRMNEVLQQKRDELKARVIK